MCDTCVSMARYQKPREPREKIFGEEEFGSITMQKDKLAMILFYAAAGMGVIRGDKHSVELARCSLNIMRNWCLTDEEAAEALDTTRLMLEDMTLIIMIRNI